MSDLLVLNRRDFFEFCAALNQFPDWANVQAWIAANEITAPPEGTLPTVADVVAEDQVGIAELAERLDHVIATLRDLRAPIEKAAEVGEVFAQFGQMMGVDKPGAGYSPNAINVLSGGNGQ